MLAHSFTLIVIHKLMKRKMKDHPSCFECSLEACSVLLDQYHYILGGKPYCEQHAHELEEEEASSHTKFSNPYSDADAYYDVEYADKSSQRPASKPVVAPCISPLSPPDSISALRKRAQSPIYGRGGTRPAYAPPRPGPPPTISTRRAEKRRTVIQRV